MKISLEHTGKRFQQHWIFNKVNLEFTAPNSYALLGPNGSGKSTLLRVVAGMQTVSVGKVHYDINGSKVESNAIYRHISFCAPGMDIVEELTLQEFLTFHFNYKKSLNGLNVADIISIIGLQAAKDKLIGDYSSGMRQRVKLAQAIFSDTPVLMLDEPCTNLDQQGVEQYREWIETYAEGRLVIVASNDIREYYFCKNTISVEDYKF